MTNVYPLGIYEARKSNVYHTTKQEHLSANQEEMSESESPFWQTGCLVVRVYLVILIFHHFPFLARTCIRSRTVDSKADGHIHVIIIRQGQNLQ